MSDRKYVWATGGSHYLHLPGIVPSFCEILYLHLICTQLSTSPIRRRRSDRKGKQICNFQMNKYRFSKWINTFSNPTNTSVETFPNEFPSPRQHLLHPGTMGKSHTQHPNIRQLPIVPQVQKTLIFTERFKWHVPQFSFLQGQLYNHMMKQNNPFKRNYDEDCWNLHLVEQVSFCKKFGILQPCPQCPGQYLASWHSHCEYGVVLALPLLSLISGILGQDRSTTSGVGRLSG